MSFGSAKDLGEEFAKFFKDCTRASKAKTELQNNYAAWLAEEDQKTTAAVPLLPAAEEDVASVSSTAVTVASAADIGTGTTTAAAPEKLAATEMSLTAPEVSLAAPEVSPTATEKLAATDAGPAPVVLSLAAVLRRGKVEGGAADDATEPSEDSSTRSTADPMLAEGEVVTYSPRKLVSGNKSPPRKRARLSRQRSLAREPIVVQ